MALVVKKRRKLRGKGSYNHQLTRELYRKFANTGTRKKVNRNFRGIGGRGRKRIKKKQSRRMR